MLPLRQTLEQLAGETNVVLLRTKVIAECIYARGTVVCVPEKKAQRDEQTEEDVLVPLHPILFQQKRTNDVATFQLYN